MRQLHGINLKAKESKMSTEFFRTKEFKKLQDKWYKKLKQSGFKSIEWFNKNAGRSQDSCYLKKENEGAVTVTYMEESMAHHERTFLDLPEYQYYNQVSKLVHSDNIKTERDRVMLEMHADGKSYRDISRHMFPRRDQYGRDVRYSHSWIFGRVKKLLKENGIIRSEKHERKRRKRAQTNKPIHIKKS